MKMTPMPTSILHPASVGTVPQKEVMREGVETPSRVSNPFEYMEGLLEKTYDGHHGYAKAAKLTDCPELKRFFSGNSEQRAEFAAELEGILRGTRNGLSETGTLAAKLHRGRMVLASKFTEVEERLLDECRVAEESALDEYQKITERRELPGLFAEVVRRQRDRVKDELATVKEFKDLVATDVIC